MNKTAKSMDIFLIFLMVLSFSACSNTEKEKTIPQKKELAEVKVKTLKKEPKAIWVDYSSKAEAYSSAKVISRVEGELIKQYFKPGQSVKRGDILFSIDKSNYEASVNEAMAKLEKDKASLDLAIAELSRYQPLVEEQLAPRQKLDQLIASKKQLEATIKSDKVVLEDAKLKLSYCDITAQIDGKIGKEDIKVGNLVKSGTVMTNIIDSSLLLINFYPDTKDTAHIQKYKSKALPNVEVFLRDNPSIKLKGSVEYIAPSVDESTGTVPMRAKVINPKEEILPGSFVTIRLIVNSAYPVVAISPKWIYQDQEGEFIYIVNNNILKKYHFHSLFSNEQMTILPDDAKGLKVMLQPIGKLTTDTKVIPIESNNTKEVN